MKKAQETVVQQEKEEEKREIVEAVETSDFQAASAGQNVSGVTRLFYIAGTLAAFTILIIGMAVLQNLDPKNSMQDTLNSQTEGIISSSPPDFVPQITEAQIQEEESTDIFSYFRNSSAHTYYLPLNNSSNSR